MMSGRDGRLLGAVLGAACVACVAVALACIRAVPLLYYEDAVHYVSLGEGLASGRGFTSTVFRFPDLMQPPLYPALIALGSGVLGSIGAAVAVCVGAAALTVIALVLLHREAFGEGRETGWAITAAVAAVYPNLAFGAALVLEPLFVCAIAWAAWLAVSGARRGAALRFAGAGLLLGLAFLTRSEAVITMAVLGALAIAWPGAARRRKALAAGALAVALAAVLVPYGLWMKARLGAFEVLPKVRYNVPYADITHHMAWEPDEAKLGGREQRTFFTLMPDRATFVMNHAFEHPDFDPRPHFPRRAEERAGLAATARQLAGNVRAVASDAIASAGTFHPVALALLVAGVWAGLRGGAPRARRSVDGAGDGARDGARDVGSGSSTAAARRDGGVAGEGAREDESSSAASAAFAASSAASSCASSVPGSSASSTGSAGSALGLRGRRTAVLALLALAALHAGPAVVSGVDYDSRYLAASLLFAVPLMAAGAAILGARVRARVAGPMGRWAGLAIAALLVAAYGLATARLVRNAAGGPAVLARYEALTEATARHVREGARVMAEHSRYALLRRGHAFQLPYVRSLDELRDYVARHRIDTVLLDARTLRNNPSRVVRALRDPATWPPEWRLVQRLFDADLPAWIVRVDPGPDPTAPVSH